MMIRNGKRCQAYVERKYTAAGRCEKTKNVELIRWAPTPLRTIVTLLCQHHKNFLERHGQVPLLDRRPE